MVSCAKLGSKRVMIDGSIGLFLLGALANSPIATPQSYPAYGKLSRRELVSFTLEIAT